MTEPTDTELDAVVCKHWPAFSMQATLVRMWVRAAMRDAIAKWDTPPAEQQARWVERWHGSGGKEFWEGWSILNAANREMIAHLGPDVDPGVVRGIVTAHNDALCGECAGTGGRWCPACAGATPPAEKQAAPKAAPGEPDPADIIAGALQISRGHAIEMMREALETAPQQEAQEPVAWQGVHDQTDLYYTKPLQADVRPLYTTPQPAPAPLSDDTKRLAWMADGWTPGHEKLYAQHVLKTGGVGDLDDLRTFIDKQIAAQGDTP